jgi:hypothetical protein
MSVHTRLEALKAKHRASEVELAEAMSHPSASDREIVEIKHRKLQIKDEIAHLEAHLDVAVV